MAEIEFRSVGFTEAAASLRRAGDPELVAERLNRMLRRVGHLLVPALQAVTPVGATHHLRNAPYTHSRIFPMTVSPTGMAQRMEVRQSARSKEGYFYGQAVIGGTRPHWPPSSQSGKFVSVLIPWINAVLGIYGRKADSVAFLIGRKMSRVGTQPNPYHERVLAENMGAIQGIVDQEGAALSVELWKPRR